ncbi:MAG: hypothetical protein MK100_03375 [Phycisphaerales bacterium]|nr:hypothetical protein [Phycisphaerales bacterium]
MKPDGFAQIRHKCAAEPDDPTSGLHRPIAGEESQPPKPRIPPHDPGIDERPMILAARYAQFIYHVPIWERVDPSVEKSVKPVSWLAVKIGDASRGVASDITRHW